MASGANQKKLFIIDLPLLTLFFIMFVISFFVYDMIYVSLIILLGLIAYQTIDTFSVKKKRTVTTPPAIMVQKPVQQPVIQQTPLSRQSQTSSISLPSLSDWNPELWVGRELYGYKIVSVIGSGGNGYVVKAVLGNSNYAIKILSITPSQKGTVTVQAKSGFDELFKESENLKRLSQYPSFVTIYGIYIDSNIIKNALLGNVESYLKYPPAIVMEFMEGGSVDGLLKNQNIIYSQYWPLIVKVIIKEVAQALDFLHSSGYVHLDVKPQNIFLKTKLGITGEEVYKRLPGNIKLGDLGSAVRIGGKVEQVTPAYAPPEQIEAIILGKGADPKMDIFALGMSAYVLLNFKTGSPATIYMNSSIDDYLTGNVSQALAKINQAKQVLASWNPDLPQNTPKELEEVIIKSLSVNPSDRPTASEIVKLLSQ